MAYLRDGSGIAVGFRWHSSEMAMAYLWDSDGIPQRSQWHSCGIPMAYLRHRRGIPQRSHAVASLIPRRRKEKGEESAVWNLPRTLK